MNTDKESLLDAFNSGRVKEAWQLASQLILAGEEDALIFRLRGHCQESMGLYQKAISDYQKSLQLEPGDSETLARYGSLLGKLGKLQEGIAALTAAIRINSGFIEAYYNLGVLLSQSGRHEQAVAIFETASANEPDNWRLLVNLSVGYSILGKKDLAISAIERAIGINPDFAESYRILSTVKKIPLRSPITERIRTALNDGDLEDKDRQLYHYTLAKILHDGKKHDQAFANWKAANDSRKAELAYSIEKDVKLFKSVQSVFKEDVPALEMSELETDRVNPVPIFIVGMPRSGTSLLEQILASHAQVYGAGELNFLTTAVAGVKGLADSRGKDQLRRFRDLYFQGVDSLAAFSEAYFTDKMPLNFRWIGYMAKAFPEARIVHVRRDARAVCWSNYRRYFAGKEHGFAYDLQDVAQYYKLYWSLMQYWRELLPGKVIEVNYEELTEAPELVSRKLLDSLGLEWDEQCLNYFATKRAVNTASSLQVREKIYQGSSQQWQAYASHLQELEAALADY